VGEATCKDLPQGLRKKALLQGNLVEKEIQQGLKPIDFIGPFGTTEVVPCYRAPCLRIFPEALKLATLSTELLTPAMGMFHTASASKAAKLAASKRVMTVENNSPARCVHESGSTVQSNSNAKKVE
jgi:hypothetical protein